MPSWLYRRSVAGERHRNWFSLSLPDCLSVCLSVSLSLSTIDFPVLSFGYDSQSWSSYVWRFSASSGVIIVADCFVGEEIFWWICWQTVNIELEYSCTQVQRYWRMLNCSRTLDWWCTCMVTDINIVVKLPVRGEMVPDRMTHKPCLQLC